MKALIKIRFPYSPDGNRVLYAEVGEVVEGEWAGAAVAMGCADAEPSEEPARDGKAMVGAPKNKARK